MPEVSIDFVRILLAGVANMAVGFAWYSPMLFGNVWMKLMHLSKSDAKKGAKDMPRIIGLSFIATLIMAFVLRHMSFYAGTFYNMSGIPVGLINALWLWFGMIMPVQLTGWLYEKAPFKLFLINTGYQLVSMLAMGVVLWF